MASNTNTMAPIATHDTARTAITPGEAVPTNEKRGLFGRRQHAAPPSGTQGEHTPVAGPYGHSFKFGQWLKLHILDLITMAAMGAIGLGVYEADPAPTRNFPIFNNNQEVVYPEFAYPVSAATHGYVAFRVVGKANNLFVFFNVHQNRKNIIPIYAAALIAFFVPFVFFVLFQIRHRSPEMLLGSTMGLLEGLITAAVFQVFNKWLIGGLRPHFLDVCKPDFSRQTGMGFMGYMYTREVCTGDAKDINDSLESWMSGHSTAAFAGLIYLFFYFNAQLKVMSDHRGAYWKYVLTIAPVCGAVLIAASLTVDEYHSWYDCVGGALTGTFCAFIAYRKTFAAIWDFRFNHILLPRSTSLFHRHASEGMAGKFGYSVQESLMHRPFTSEGGWREHEPYGGAPNDAVGLGQNAGSGGMPGSMGVSGSPYAAGGQFGKPAQVATMV